MSGSRSAIRATPTSSRSTSRPAACSPPRRTSPALSLLAPSLHAYLESYSRDLEAGTYAVTEGFGGSYLEEVD